MNDDIIRTTDSLSLTSDEDGVFLHFYNSSEIGLDPDRGTDLAVELGCDFGHFGPLVFTLAQEHALLLFLVTRTLATPTPATTPIEPED